MDHYIKHTLGVQYYGRYVDDMIIVDNDKEYLRLLIPLIGSFLQLHLGLTLHPRKVYLRHYRKGVPFLGVFIKPGRIFPGRRSGKNCRRAVERLNAMITDHKPSRRERKHFRSCVNSCLGLMKLCDGLHFIRTCLRSILLPDFCVKNR